jgi:hypothetical protein
MSETRTGMEQGQLGPSKTPRGNHTVRVITLPIAIRTSKCRTTNCCSILKQRDLDSVRDQCHQRRPSLNPACNQCASNSKRRTT